MLTSLQSSKRVLQVYDASPAAAGQQVRQIRSVRRSLTRTTLLTLVYAHVITKVFNPAFRGCQNPINGLKGGLLQLSSLGYFRTTVTTAAVCLQRRRSSRVLR